MSKRLTIEQMFDLARAATKASSRWVYETTYAGGGHTISRREPDGFAVHLMAFCSWDYAAETDVSTPTALRHLRKLAAAGRISETNRYGTACAFEMPHDVAKKIGREHIEELRAEGLPFDDEWRKQKAEGRV